MTRRVLLIPSWYPSTESRVNGIFIEDQAKILAERFDVLVFTQTVYGWRDAFQGRIPSGSGFSRRNGVHLYEQRIFLPPKLPIRAAMAYRLGHARAAMRILRQNWGIPDLIHAHVVLPGGWIAVRLGRKLNVPVVLTEHTGPFLAHLTSTAHQAMVRETLKSCSKVIAVSPFLAHQIMSFCPSQRIEVVGNVIPTRFFEPGACPPPREPQGAPLRLFSASILTKEKGHDHLLRAARMLLDSGFRKFELHIGGNGPDKPRLQSLIQDLKLQDTCQLLGMLERSEMRDWMQRCDIFVLPSLAETFGVVIGEAMACGKPVLATHCGGADFQVTPDTGILVAPGDSGALAAGIRKLDSERSRYDPLAIRTAVMRRFGEDAFLETIEEKYHDAVSGGIA